MVPRADVVYLSTARPLAENLRLARKSGHTRFPLCEGDLDHVIGLVHIKDLFRRERPVTSLEEVARDITFVPETLGLDRLLKRMRAERFHVAAVIDEYGGVSGIVAMENVIEVIVGQIQDEFDTRNPSSWTAATASTRSRAPCWSRTSRKPWGSSSPTATRIPSPASSSPSSAAAPWWATKVELGPVTIEVLEVSLNRINTLQITVHAPETVPPVEG